MLKEMNFIVANTLDKQEWRDGIRKNGGASPGPVRLYQWLPAMNDTFSCTKTALAP
ncbi:hypothetical protein BN137_3321 [Cronobacter condimenti 1330]|uniref:Uncharacterized protein n=1 Tax=Cronobacter condimenti 1330 TaxID=1073999 RepID=K8A399_9ENTR|nr:hypothetical protein BN137_3321 [Cronobacter condimenti 1330]